MKNSSLESFSGAIVVIIFERDVLMHNDEKNNETASKFSFYFLLSLGIIIVSIPILILINSFSHKVQRDLLDEMFPPSESLKLVKVSSSPMKKEERNPSHKPALRLAIAPVISPESSFGLYNGLVGFSRHQAAKGWSAATPLNLHGSK